MKKVTKFIAGLALGMSVISAAEAFQSGSPYGLSMPTPDQPSHHGMNRNWQPQPIQYNPAIQQQMEMQRQMEMRRQHNIQMQRRCARFQNPHYVVNVHSPMEMQEFDYCARLTMRRGY